MGAERSRTSDAHTAYEIRVVGVLDSTWSDAFGGMKLTHDAEATGPLVTVLNGPLDQAALAGVLDSLFGLGLTVVSVRCCPTNAAS
jgi:hypothetical protein